MCLPGSTDARLVLSQRRRLAGGSLAGLQGSRETERKKRASRGNRLTESNRYVKGKRSEGPGSQEVMWNFSGRRRRGRRSLVNRDGCRSCR